MYFCYYEQFLAELKRFGLTLNDFLGKFYDENNTNLTLQVNSLNVKSILTKYGYSVSKQKGLSSAKRYQILSFIIDKDIMTKAHVISHIQYLVHYNGKKNSNKDAVVKWKEDIEKLHLNKCVRYMTKVDQQMEIISYKNNTILIFDMTRNNNENY